MGRSVATVSAGGVSETAEAVGPVNAIDIAMRRVLSALHPALSAISLSDYRVVLPGSVNSTESVVRVTIEFEDGEHRWRTMGVSSNIIDASVMGMLDGINYFLWRKDDQTRRKQ